ncbi:hypothetical protein L4D06_16835 [Enterovibrio makurazakiensis]|uniref:PilZ domain-containing protein n=1 Tax=Enterovibrio gelatinilyticus TaxID=2899819 RepID=A0ABT5R371_9GAMM|nr:hypothetical protein [Enterovibrio sp. ZSDZ42]MDD1794216.1 hypothetical protein [Enterovibrio sp. ZSDZ42]
MTDKYENQEHAQGDDQEEEEQKRNFFRLRYLEQDMPYIAWDGCTYRVCEISEHGIRLLFEGDVVLDQPFSGTVQFEEGSADIQGKAIRKEDGELIIQLFQKVELKKINAEQIRLRRKYSKD